MSYTGNLPISEANPLPVAQTSNLYRNITTAASTQVKTGSGVLSGISINTGGAGSTVKIYDGTTTGGPVIGTFSTATQGSLVLPPTAFAVGLLAVTANGTPADITIYYR